MKWQIGGAMAALALATASPALATGDKHCNVAPGAKWMTAEQAAAKVRELGYSQIREIERDDNCWEVEARDSRGAEIEIYIHPVSGEVVKLERD